ncbi:MAG TPA: hypothetical protein DET40_01260 [Lentisphaeria bacterium]|nr:MAG: hypothetical protein A2X45_12620 [Lentisphaerae bacterium GWF2_50_93]HCE42160.1 hypothetical protein [Lentisphaeria bacterium]
MKYLPFILLVILSCSTSPLHAQYSTEQGNDARNIWLKGFEIYEQAESAKKSGDNKSSISLYQESLSFFQKVKKQYPRWNSALVDHRIKACNIEIQSLAVPGAVPPAATAPVTTTPVATAPAKTIIPAANTDTGKELSDLRAKLVLSEKEKLDLEDKLSKSSKEADELGKKLKDLAGTPAAGEIAKQLQSENEKLKKELEAGKAKVDKAEKDTLEKTRIAEDNMLIAAKLWKAEESLADAKKESSKHSAEVEKLKKKIPETASETVAGQKIITQLSEENKALKTQLEAQSKQSDVVKAQLESLRKDLEKFSGQDKKYQELQKMNADNSIKNAELAKSNTELISKQADLARNMEAATKERDEFRKKADSLSSDNSKKAEALSRKEEELKTALKSAGAGNTDELVRIKARVKELEDKAESAEQLRIERDDFKARLLQKTVEADSLKKANEKIKAEKTVTVEKIIKELADEKDQPGEAEMNILLKAGDEADKKGNKDAAISQYEKVLSMDPENQYVLSKLAFIYSERRSDEMTLKYVERALRIQPNDVQNLLIAGSAYIRRGEYYSAIGVLSRGVAQDPKNPKLQRYLGVACSNLEWIEAAEKQFKTAFDLDPKSSESALYLATLYATCEKPKMDEAKKWYKKARELGAKSDPAIEDLIK